MSGDHSQDLVGKEGHKLTLAEGRGEELHKPTHALKEETLGKEGLKEHREDRKAALEEHREARAEGFTADIPDPHKKDAPHAHHHVQHAQAHAPGEEHKP